MKKLILFLFLSQLNVLAQKNVSKFIVFANVGPSYRLASISDGYSPQEREYIKKLKKGISYDFAAYYYKNNSGYGLKYNTFKTSNDYIGPVNLDPTSILPTSYSDNVTISYIGPSFIYTEDHKAKVGEAFFEVSFGYMSLRNEGTVDFEKIIIKGSNFGMIAGGGYHFRLHKNFLLGPQVSFVGGTLRKIEVTNSFSTQTIKLDKDNYESLWRIDLSISAKVKF